MMALKRKDTSEHDTVPAKKVHKDTPKAYPKQGIENCDDHKVKYTENGTKRALSEACRQWIYACPVEGCAQRFNRPCRLENHMRSHNNERPFACPESGCGKMFPRKDHLQRHVKNAHNDPVVERTHFCDWVGCDKSFTSNARLRRHKDVHESKFYCTEYPPCNQVFRRANVLEAHIKSQHLQVKPYPCTIVDSITGETCTAGYQTEASLQRHFNSVHAKATGDEYFCTLCMIPAGGEEMVDAEASDIAATPAQPLSFATKKEFAAHRDEHHPPICSECGQRFKNAFTLKSHWAALHGDPRQQPQFTCPQPGCGSVFNRKHNLTVHLKSVHDNERRYFCTSEAQLDSKHDDLKAWKGEDACGAAFKAKSSLDQHIRTHHLNLGNRKEVRKAAKSRKKPEPSLLTLLTGVGYEKGRRFTCLVERCEHRFYSDRDLRRHARSVHDLSDDQVTGLMQERDALAGGRFWIGNADEEVEMCESMEHSMPQTPVPCISDYGGALYGDGSKQCDASDLHLSYLDQPFEDMLLDSEDVKMDEVMGLDGLSVAVDVRRDLVCGFSVSSDWQLCG